MTCVLIVYMDYRMGIHTEKLLIEWWVYGLDGCMGHDDEFMDYRTGICYMLAAIMVDINVIHDNCSM